MWNSCSNYEGIFVRLRDRTRMHSGVGCLLGVCSDDLLACQTEQEPAMFSSGLLVKVSRDQRR